MDKVYIVQIGSYSDRRIDKIFSTEELAKNYCDLNNKFIDVSQNIQDKECSYELDHYYYCECGVDRFNDLDDRILVCLTHTPLRNVFDLYVDPYGNKEFVEYFEDKEVDDSGELYLNRFLPLTLTCDVEQEVERLKKVCYDKLKQVIYIKEVLGITNLEEINKLIQ